MVQNLATFTEILSPLRSTAHPLTVSLQKQIIANRLVGGNFPVLQSLAPLAAYFCEFGELSIATVFCFRGVLSA